MNKFIITLLSALVSFSIWAQDVEQDTKEQQAKEVTQERQIGHFNEIQTSNGINVTLIEGNKEHIEIKIKGSEPDNVITEIKKGVLYVKMKAGLNKGVAVQVNVTYKTISSITATFGSYIDTKGSIATQSLTIKATTDAAVILEVDAEKIDASVTAGRIELTGNVTKAEVSASTGGKYYAGNLNTQDTFIKASMGGVAEVRAKNILDAKANSGGKIYYMGLPNKRGFKTSLGGSIEPYNKE